MRTYEPPVNTFLAGCGLRPEAFVDITTLGLNMLLSGILKYYVRGLFTNHINRTYNEEPGDARKDRSIYDPQSLRAVNSKCAVKYPLLLPRTNRATAGRMMTPGMGAHELAQFVARLDILPRQHFFRP